MSEIICRSISNGREFGMREATKEERESVDNYIKSISKKLHTFTDEQLSEHDFSLLDKVTEKLKAKYPPYFNEFGMCINDTLHKDIDEVIAELKVEVKNE